MAETKTLHAIIARLEASVFDGEARSVQVPGVLGEMEILPGHEPLISPLKPGDIVVTLPDGEKHVFPCEGGTLEVHQSQVTILL